MGAQNFDEYFKRFGLNTPTGVDLPGESEGLYYGDLVALDAMSDEYLLPHRLGKLSKLRLFS